VTIKESPADHYLSKRGRLVLLGIFVSLFWVMHVTTQPQLAQGQDPLTDIRNIKTLRAQFNRDDGLVRLVILVAPT
jgi:hypothetical protein